MIGLRHRGVVQRVSQPFGRGEEDLVVVLDQGYRGAVQPAVGIDPSARVAASPLYLSVNTVETHLAHAYRKLGIRARAELAGHDLD